MFKHAGARRGTGPQTVGPGSVVSGLTIAESQRPDECSEPGVGVKNSGSTRALGLCEVSDEINSNLHIFFFLINVAFIMQQ